MRELDDQLKRCIRCGMCMSVCPLFAETGREEDVARGKMALLDGLSQEMFKNPKGVFHRLNRCLLCGSCAVNCPSGVNALEIFLKARSILTGYMGLSLAKKALFRGLLARPETFDRLMAFGARCQNIFTRPANESLGTSCARIVSPLIENRHFVPLARMPFHQTVPSMNTSPDRTSTGTGIKVAFFVGCLIDKVFPRVAKATLHVLNHHGIGVFMPEDQGCCGIPALSSGDLLTFNRLVHHNLDRFLESDVDFLVTACATCSVTIKKLWPMMVQDESVKIRNRVDRVAEKVLDINQFMVSHVGVQGDVTERDPDAPVVSYHDPCHLLKSLGVSDEPRTLIKANSRYRFKEMFEADHCCGLGGTFGLTHYDMSTTIGKRKQDNIKASGCSTVATACPACMIQISDMLSKSGDSISVKHPIEIYASTLKSL
jgi:glycolate oxidase iron-sulfur subunit